MLHLMVGYLIMQIINIKEFSHRYETRNQNNKTPVEGR